MSIVLDGTSGIIVSGNTNTFSGVTVGEGGGALSSNTAMGTSALNANTTGSNNTAIGSQSLISNTTGANNVAIGYAAADSITTGERTVAIGSSALQANTTGSYSVAIGYIAGFNTNADDNVAIGANASYSNSTGTGNVAIGRNALYTAGAQSEQVSVGIYSLESSTTGANNVAIGGRAMRANTTGGNNTALGYQALTANTTASNNTGVGYQAGFTNQTGVGNTFIGDRAAYTSNASGNAYNTIIGSSAGYSLTTGTSNTFIGSSATANSSGYFVTTGSKNTILGGYSGNQGGLDIRTASNYIVLSDGDGNPRAWIGAGNSNDLFRVGTTSTSTTDWMHQISYSQTSRFIIGFTNDTTAANPSGLSIRYPNSGGAASTDFYIYAYNTGGLRFGAKNDGGISNYQANNTNISDRREKEDFAEAGNYLNKICAIPVQTFRYIDRDVDDTAFTLGVVAQDVQAVAPELVTESDWSPEKDGSKMRLSVYQTDLQYALMKAIQELKAEFDAYKASHP